MNEDRLIADATKMAQDFGLEDEMLVIAVKFYFYGAVLASGWFNAADEMTVAGKVQGLTAKVFERLLD